MRSHNPLPLRRAGAETPWPTDSRHFFEFTHFSIHHTRLSPTHFNRVRHSTSKWRKNVSIKYSCHKSIYRRTDPPVSFERVRTTNVWPPVSRIEMQIMYDGVRAFCLFAFRYACIVPHVLADAKRRLSADNAIECTLYVDGSIVDLWAIIADYDVHTIAYRHTRTLRHRERSRRARAHSICIGFQSQTRSCRSPMKAWSLSLCICRW